MSIWNKESREADNEREQWEEKPQGGFFDLPKSQFCRHPGHKFPSHLYIPPGKGYTHICPGCGHKITVISNSVFMAG